MPLLALALCQVTAGCGDAADAGPDTGGGADTDTGGGHNDGGWPEYEGPGDFDRSECRGGVDAVDLEGIWHLAAEREAGYRPQWFRPEGEVLHLREAGGELSARVAGSWRRGQAERIDDGLFLRSAEPLEYEHVLFACTAEDDDTIYGRYADCWHLSFAVECLEAEFRAVRVSARDEAPAAGLEELAVYGGPDAAPWNVGERAATAVATDGQLVYLARAGAGLAIVDVSEPAEPVEIGRRAISDVAERGSGLTITRGPGDEVYAIVAAAARVEIVNVTEPAEPEVVAEIMAEGAGSVSAFADDDRLYVVTVDSFAHTPRAPPATLTIYDFADPTAPSELGSYLVPRASDVAAEIASATRILHPEFTYDLYVDDELAYLSHGRDGLLVLDVSEPLAVELIASFVDDEDPYSRAGWPVEAGGQAILLHVDERFGGILRVLDGELDATSFLEPMGALATRPEVSASQVVSAGAHAYLANHQDGLRVIDLADPSTPVEVGHYHSWPGPAPGYSDRFAEGIVGVAVDGTRGLIYLADSHRGLIIFREE